MKMKEYIGLCAGVLVSPGDACFYIKRNKNRLSLVFPAVMLAVLALLYVVFIQLTNYAVSTVNLRSESMLIYIVLPVAAVVLWTVSGYAVSTILDGSAGFKEFAVSVASCVMPFVALALPLTAVSYLLEMGQASFFGVLQYGILLWIIALLFYNFMTLNEYSFKKAVGTAVLGLLVMLAICFILFILYSMTNQVITFIKQVMLEIQLLTV